MAENERLLDAQGVEEAGDEPRLLAERVVAVGGPVGVAEALEVEGDGAEMGRQVWHEEAEAEGGAVQAVQQEERRPFARFDVVEANAVDVDLPARLRRRPRGRCLPSGALCRRE